jgi:hypothetical protein
MYVILKRFKSVTRIIVSATIFKVFRIEFKTVALLSALRSGDTLNNDRIESWSYC